MSRHRITREELSRITALVRLPLETGHFDLFAAQLETIVGLFDELRRLELADTSAFQDDGGANAWREDDPQPSLEWKHLEKIAPLTRDGQIIVPQVIT